MSEARQEPKVLRSLRQRAVFFTEYFRTAKTTGSAFATSHFAARALSAPIREMPHRAKRILEVGPGTGSVTVEILKSLRRDDELVLCELNPRFMAEMRRRFSTDPDFIPHRHQVSFFECPVQELPPCGHFDVIVCALPFLNFELAVTQQIFHRFDEMLVPGGVMTHYEYIGLRDLQRILPDKEIRRRSRALERFYRSIEPAWHRDRTKVWLNMLPIYVYRLSKASGFRSVVAA